MKSMITASLRPYISWQLSRYMWPSGSMCKFSSSMIYEWVCDGHVCTVSISLALQVNIFYFEYQVAGDYVGIRDCNIYVGLIIEYGDSRWAGIFGGSQVFLPLQSCGRGGFRIFEGRCCIGIMLSQVQHIIKTTWLFLHILIKQCL